jgi:small GTP-binding protein
MDIDCHEFDDTPKIKIVLLGDRSVGKSSIVKRFIRNEFDANQNVVVPVIQPTIGIDYMSKMMQYNNKKYKLELWDTAGQEKYRSLVKNYLKDADCALFVYDVNGSYELTVDSRTYNHIPDWLSTFKEATNRESVCLIVGNKIDVKKQQGSQSNAAGSQQYSEW